jgi:type I restriction enzyme S subunit
MSVQLRNDQNRPSASGMKSLPGGWLIKPLGEVVTRIIGGGTPSRDNPAYWQGDIPWLTVKDMRTTRPSDAIDHISKNAVVESSTNIIPADTVIIATRVGLGKVIRVPYAAAINQDLKALIVPSNIEKAFLEYWFLSIASYLESIGSGTTVKGIRLEQLKALEMPVPPQKEQRCIVAEIEKQFSRLEEGVSALKRVQANLKRYRAAVLKAACEGKLVENEVKSQKPKGKSVETGEQLLKRILEERRKNWSGRGKYKEPTAPDTTNLPKLPEGWTCLSIDQMCSHITSGSRDWSKYYGKGVGTFIMAQNVRPMFLDMSERQSVAAPVGDAETERTRVNVDDLLVTIVGAKTGDVCRVSCQLDNHFVCQSVALLRPVISTLSSFMEFYLASQENGQAQWRGYIYGQGRPHLGFEQIRMTAIPLPPLAEQKRIVEEVERRLSVVEELESLVTTNLQRATRLRQAVLKKAFEGKL